ncbi:hypothetical protein [uncultured Anaerofustis sp.]|uniref:hypothetical protein n=1 Tax=uncultured Anaerofustis sp. TaxID=904996 RepID=UPI0025F26B96|nr:hypothetical protein [uncultured Anaerofustis sp.]
MKKILSVLLVLILSIGLLAGCGTKGDTKFKDSELYTKGLMAEKGYIIGDVDEINEGINYHISLINQDQDKKEHIGLIDFESRENETYKNEGTTGIVYKTETNKLKVTYEFKKDKLISLSLCGQGNKDWFTTDYLAYIVAITNVICPKQGTEDMLDVIFSGKEETTYKLKNKGLILTQSVIPDDKIICFFFVEPYKEREKTNIHNKIKI